MDFWMEIFSEAAPYFLFYGVAAIAALRIQHQDELDERRRQKRLAARAARRAAR